jgi:hypothetical protein
MARRLQGVGAVAIWLIVSNQNVRRLPPEFASTLFALICSGVVIVNTP